MSRNLCRTNCHQCHGPIEYLGETRTVTEKDAGPYYSEYEWLRVREAECAHCKSKYLAWMNTAAGVENDRHCDLSYRYSFDDEPSALDLDLPRLRWLREVQARHRAACAAMSKKHDRELRKGP